MERSRCRVRVALGLCLTVAGLLIWVSSAAATSLYLRPDADNASPLWSVTGATSRWDALNDPVTESETPSSSDYITRVSGIAPQLNVELGTTSRAGLKVLSASAWFYTPDATPIAMTVVDGTNGFEPSLASKTSSSPGWQNVTFALPSSQTKLDGLRLKFASSGFSSGTRRIYVAFVRLNVEVPSTSIYWGSWIDGDVYTKSPEPTWPDAPYGDTLLNPNPTWNLFESHAGKPVSIVHFGQPAPWNQDFAAGPFESTRRRGAIPLVDMDADGMTLASIAAGDHDAEFKKWFSDAASNFGYPMFFRWSWEMNGTWFKPYGPESAASPSLYVAVWQHLHDLAVAKGANNITWVWCPNVIFSGSTSLKALYPGDAYVDWTCMDGYNRGDNPIKPEGFKSFSEVFSQTYNELLAIAPSKPIMIGETGSTELMGLIPHPKKFEWISEGLGVELASNFPKVEAILWFNWNAPDEDTGERWDWQIESSAAAESAFRNVISSSYYAANSFGSLPSQTKVQALP